MPFMSCFRVARALAFHGVANFDVRVTFMARQVALIVIGIFAVFLSACTQDPIRGDHPNLVASPDKVSMMLANAADRASVALETLAAVEQARAPEVSVAPIDNAPPELRRAITVNWVGPAEPILGRLADRAGYSFQAMGAAPAVPLVVSVDVENMPVIDVLRSIGLQLGVRADVRVDGQGRLVEIHYAPNTGLGG